MARAQQQQHKRTAVVVIHGMGEQWPMETLRGFVDAVWSKDADLTQAWDEIYSKPDRNTGSYELRRLTTRNWRGADPRRGDFFEFYWAHLMQGNTAAAVFGWLWRLLVRSRARTPDRLVPAWIVGLVLMAGITLIALVAGMDKELKLWFMPLWAWSLLTAIAALGMALWVKPVAGDAARYLSPAPGNVAARQAIREAGIALLAKLHTDAYDRIIVVGHSLGTVVGYDVLYHAWGRLTAGDFKDSHKAGSPALKALTDLEKKAKALLAIPPVPGARTAWRKAQRAYFATLAGLTRTDPDSAPKTSPLWLVSDFITLGSPLSLSDVLLARDPKDLEIRKAMRDAPTCPPTLETTTPPRFSYVVGQDRIPHHAAVFAPVVWTNVYFPHLAGLFGDFISGPVAPLLGAGVRDVRVPIGGLRFRHLDYWKEPAKDRPWIRALRRALNLRGQDDTSLWEHQADADPVLAEKLPASPVRMVTPAAPARTATPVRTTTKP